MPPLPPAVFDVSSFVYVEDILAKEEVLELATARKRRKPQQPTRESLRLLPACSTARSRAARSRTELTEEGVCLVGDKVGLRKVARSLRGPWTSCKSKESKVCASYATCGEFIRWFEQILRLLRMANELRSRSRAQRDRERVEAGWDGFRRDPATMI